MTIYSYARTMDDKSPGDACQRPGVWPTVGGRHGKGYLFGGGLREPRREARTVWPLLPDRMACESAVQLRGLRSPSGRQGSVHHALQAPAQRRPDGRPPAGCADDGPVLYRGLRRAGRITHMVPEALHAVEAHGRPAGRPHSHPTFDVHGHRMRARAPRTRALREAHAHLPAARHGDSCADLQGLLDADPLPGQGRLLRPLLREGARRIPGSAARTPDREQCAYDGAGPRDVPPVPGDDPQGPVRVLRRPERGGGPHPSDHARRLGCVGEPGARVQELQLPEEGPYGSGVHAGEARR